MIELERRALMGDREAQEECTRQGIVLACPWCGCKVSDLKKTQSILSWNTRTSPPVGMCGECANAYDVGDNLMRCDIFDVDMMPDDFCNHFKPKQQEE